MKQIDSVCGDTIKEYKRLSGSDKFVNVFTTNSLELSEEILRNTLEIYKDKKVKSKIPHSYEQLPYGKFIPYNVDPFIDRDRKHRFAIKEKTGLFKLTFNDGSFLLIARWMEGFGKNWTIRSIAVGDNYTYYALLKAVQAQIKKRAKPKNGVFRAIYNQQFGTVEYLEVKDLPTSPVIHPQVDIVEKDLNFYFENVSIYTRYKQSGIRKFMLISEPGTGKTSLFYKIAHEHRAKKCIIFCTDIQTAASHISACAKHKVSTIIFLEDADSCLSANQPGGTGSSVLNFLDGVDTPYNPYGALILMSTNFPDNIEERILARPGRIDKIYKFDSLSDTWAYKCAKLYFGEYFDVTKCVDEITSLVDGMTGAQIKELSLSSMSFAASNQREISIPLIKEVKDIFSNNLKDAMRYADMNSLKKLKGKNKRFGFSDEEAGW